MKKKEIILGFLFALVVTIFMNYVSIERFGSMAEADRARLAAIHFYYPIAWYALVSIILYGCFTFAFKLQDRNLNKYVVLAVIMTGVIVMPYLLGELSPSLRTMLFTEPAPPPGRKVRVFGRSDMNIIISRHYLTAILNLLFVYLLRLMYQNQEIRIRNEHLQLEKIKAEHNALIQQINPHFFFNSLNGLSYYISTSQTQEAQSYLENLTAVFRQILKHNDKEVYSLEQELTFIKSYVYMLQKRFEGKIVFDFNITADYNNYLLPRLALLPIFENIVKHNKISSANIVTVEMFVSDDQHLVVRNNIVAKLDEVESNGIGLTNLREQYELLFDKQIRVVNEGGYFSVELPLVVE